MAIKFMHKMNEFGNSWFVLVVPINRDRKGAIWFHKSLYKIKN